MASIHLGLTLPSGSSGLPEDGLGTFYQDAETPSMSSYSALLQVGFDRCRVSTDSRALLPPVFILA